MKPTSHDPLDDLIAAALHGEITPAERAQLDARLASEPAARAAYHEAQLMNDLLEKTHTAAQPDPGFEQRMVSGVRRKIADAQRPRESAWQSLVVLWTFLNNIFGKGSAWQYGTACVAVCVVAFSVLIVTGSQVKSVFTTISGQLSAAQSRGGEQYFATDQLSDQNRAATRQLDSKNAVILSGANTFSGATTVTAGALQTDSGGLSDGSGMGGREADGDSIEAPVAMPAPKVASAQAAAPAMANFNIASVANNAVIDKELKAKTDASAADLNNSYQQQQSIKAELSPSAPNQTPATSATPQSGTIRGSGFVPPGAVTPAPADADITRKLIRNAELELEVKSFQAALDQIAALTKTAGGYIDSDNSQRGGNGKLQGTVVVKVLPQNLDDFLLKLRDLGELKNQTLSTEDVTKDYVDTQARLENSRRMETQLQQLLEHTNGKVSDLLQVERELGRVRGEIEQMQGQLKLYDFQVEYATVTMQINEKDLNQAAAYLLKEQDNFTLLATDVETAFQQARHTADDFKAQVLTSNLNHNSGSNVSAVLVVMVPPDQIEPFLAQVRTLGRVANFTRQSQRVARDGGDSDQPADETRTEKDKVEVQITIGSDDESRKQVALTVVTPMVDDAFEKAKTAALASAGTEILGSSLNKTPQGQSTAQMSVRVPGKDYEALLEAFRALGRTASFSLQRNDDLGPGANGDDAPVIVNLALTDDETPLQQTQLSVLAQDVDSQAQQLKQAAADAGVEIKASTFNRQPDGIETAQMVFRLPMAKYPAFIEVVKKLGKVETLTVDRNDRPDQTRTDDTAPAEIDLTMHNQGDIVADNNGLWATLRQTFGEGAGALMSSVRVIGVLVAFLVPWLIALVIVAWVGRRIYIWRKR
jgi:autotransporter-associated beta strand protein